MAKPAKLASLAIGSRYCAVSQTPCCKQVRDGQLLGATSVRPHPSRFAPLTTFACSRVMDGARPGDWSTDIKPAFRRRAIASPLASLATPKTPRVLAVSFTVKE